MHEQMPRVFISYGPEDAEFVAWLSESLHHMGHYVWVDRDQIFGGSRTFDAIHHALDQSEVMLLVVTPESLRSRLVSSEWTYFYYEREKNLIPIFLRPLESPDKLNFMLAALQSIDFHREDRENALNSLHNTLNEVYSQIEGDNQSEAKVPEGFQTPNQWTAQDKLRAGKAGLIYVHLGMPLEVYISHIRQAKRLIRVLNTWTGIFYDHTYLLVEPVRRGCTVQILLLDPSSAFARQRSLDLHLGNGSEQGDTDEVPKNIQASIRQFASIYPELEGLAGRLELRLYNLLPSFSVHQWDDRALIGFFPHTSRTTTFPMLEVELNTLLGIRFNEEFEAIWENSVTIDLSPHLPARIAAANEALEEPLSVRELEILGHISAGMSNQEIAQKLVVTMATVKKHINNLYSKLGVASRTRAVLRAQQLNLV